MFYERAMNGSLAWELSKLLQFAINTLALEAEEAGPSRVSDPGLLFLLNNP